MDIRRETLPAQPYYYVDCETDFDGTTITAAMGDAFRKVFDHLAGKGIAPGSTPITVYLEMSREKLRFRSGVIVAPGDADQPEGEIETGTLPAGDAMVATHVGPYATLNQTHKTLQNHMQTEGIEAAMPVWEIYVDDPGSVPEGELRTEIYRFIG
ncbi:GyrI-like domain-containing protein [Pseudoruegeria sp. HB172150]|uniref:GyrI-like domain-containing protein n=1 Tax=Pseudoruegeria sp. HB172150 TaxID=2721164 RepID=UPI0015538E40|nr:GyrI-like domain-containing protein [Pseudoruegeria sp. HB172150]